MVADGKSDIDVNKNLAASLLSTHVPYLDVARHALHAAFACEILGRRVIAMASQEAPDQSTKHIPYTVNALLRYLRKAVWMSDIHTGREMSSPVSIAGLVVVLRGVSEVSLK